jgi:DNA-binding transcriptional LysR family regulator
MLQVETLRNPSIMLLLYLLAGTENAPILVLFLIDLRIIEPSGLYNQIFESLQLSKPQVSSLEFPLRTIDLELLRSLVAFDETGSLGRAAERVSRSESALCLQMKKLEELIDQRIFLKSGRRLALTEQGYMVLLYARRMLAMNDELLQLAMKPQLAGRVRIATSQDFGDEVLPRILSALSKQHPEVSFEVQVEGGILGLEALENGKADLALTIGLQNHPSARRLQHVKIAWIASPEFTYRRGAPIPLAVFDCPCRFKQCAIEALSKAGLTWEIAFTSPSLSGLWAATRAGIGITVRSSYWVPAGLQMFDREGTDLPDLGETDVAIHYYEHELSPQLLGIAKYIERSVLLQSEGNAPTIPKFGWGDARAAPQDSGSAAVPAAAKSLR